MKYFNFFIVVVFGGLMMFVLTDLPDFGDAYSPANSYVSRYYLEHSMHDTAVPNVVTSVLADYRGFDTMLETVVVFIAGLAIIFLLSTMQVKEDELNKVQESDVNLVLSISTRFLVPFIQLFAFYVIAHGHHSPGGGFQGGVMLGAGLILMALSFKFDVLFQYFSIRKILGSMVLGALIFAGTGLICLFLGGLFLDYSVLSLILPYTDAVMARSHAMLFVEIGVAFTVMSAMVAIYIYLSSKGQLKGGL